MNDEFDEALNFQYSFISEIIEKCGPRLPGSKEERSAAELIGQKFSEITGSESVIEDFKFPPKGSIGLIPVLGYSLLLLGFPLYYFNPLIHLIFLICLLMLTIIQVFRYAAWFDCIFPKSISQNVYSIMEPSESGEKGANQMPIKYTLFLVGHIDSSWHTPMFAKNPQYGKYKLAIGILGVLFWLIISIIRNLDIYNIISISDIATNVLIYFPIVFIPGFVWIARYLVWTKSRASPGAFDDLSGIAMSMWLVKYFKENPELCPKHCRIVLLAVGAEEAALKGSSAFVKKHLNDLLGDENNPWVLVLDGIGDADFIEIVCGDQWLGTRYDKTFIHLAEQAMIDVGIEFKKIINPVGGTDAAAFTRAGIRSICLAAQDPTPKKNYHTYMDTLEFIEKNATIRILQASLQLIFLLDEFIHNKKEVDKK